MVCVALLCLHQGSVRVLCMSARACVRVMQWYRIALDILPGQAGTYTSLGLCYQIKEDIKQAVEVRSMSKMPWLSSSAGHL